MKSSAAKPGWKWADRCQCRQELFLVFGRVADMAGGNEPARNIDGGLRVVALLEAAAGLHDPAFRIGEVDLVRG